MTPDLKRPAGATAFFITGTDTGCGKTLVTAALLARCKQQGSRCLGLKPVATGAHATAAGLRNDDAVLLQRYSSVRLDYAEINPYVYAAPISPHLAAAQAGKPIDLDAIVAGFHRVQPQAQTIYVEGVGGWYAPLTETHTVESLATRLALPVILVVGLRLGCLNHALLSYHAIMHSGLPLAGWIANRVNPAMDHSQGNIDTLQRLIDAPLLAVIPHQSHPDPEFVAQYFTGSL